MPVSKEWILKNDINFKGHTEILSNVFQCKTFMCMYHKNNSVVLLTNHIPIKEVSKKIAAVDISSLGKSLFFLKKFFNIKEKVALVGLNPHAGEGGKIGLEEKELYPLWKKELAKYGIEITEPVSADSAFQKENRKNILYILYAITIRG